MDDLDKSFRRIVITIAVLFLFSGVLACLASYLLNSTDTEFNASVWWGGLLQNFGTEMFGAFATFILLEIILRNQAKRREVVELKLAKQREESAQKRDERRKEQERKQEQSKQENRQKMLQKREEKKTAIFTLLSTEVKEADAFRNSLRKDVDKLQKEIGDIKKKLSIR